MLGDGERLGHLAPSDDVVVAEDAVGVGLLLEHHGHEGGDELEQGGDCTILLKMRGKS